MDYFSPAPETYSPRRDENPSRDIFGRQIGQVQPSNLEPAPMGVDYFSRIPETFSETCDILLSYSPRQDEIDRLNRCINSSRDTSRDIYVVGSGRMESIADIYAWLLTANGYQRVHSSSDTTFPFKYNTGDTVIAFSGSGKTASTNNRVETAKENGACLISVTADPASELANLTRETEKFGGFVITIPAKTKHDSSDYYADPSRRGKDTPFSMEGTEAELKSLSIVIDSIGSIYTKKHVEDYHREFWEAVKAYAPDSAKFRKAYELIPKPDSGNKLVTMGRGLSGRVCKFETVRLGHLAPKGKERRVEFYKDRGAGNIKKGDTVLIISGRGGKLIERYAGIAKNLGGNVVAFTSYPEGPLEKYADVLIEVPGRTDEILSTDRVHHHPNPRKSMFELTALLGLENLIYAIFREEGLTEEDIRSHHSPFT